MSFSESLTSKTINLIVAATGHRPLKAGLSYSHVDPVDVEYVARAKRALLERQVDLVIVGGALGWDTLFARAAFQAGIPFDLYIPFEGQHKAWPKKAQHRYQLMRDNARNVRIVSEGEYGVAKMAARNRAMVDDCHEVWALWDGSSGGTSNCVAYAETVGRPIVNFY